jgi:hypothetical protein
MNFNGLLDYVTDKERFETVENYIDFCHQYLEYIETELQARIISQNESNYQFFQYRKEGGFNITRPLNSKLMYDAETFSNAVQKFKQVLTQLKDGEKPLDALRQTVICTIYTIQQSIGAMLDALPAGKSNQARKINGDLFERLIRLLVVSLDVDCVSGTMQVPVKDVVGEELFKSSYQHDLLISKDSELKIIGSVKTSSKDRIDKVFMDKFLYNKLTATDLPHIAIFLNDVQRKKTRRENEYSINSTFLSGHFKAYTIKLNPLDGVYYCDIRPNMIEDNLLSQHIKTIDHFFYADLWNLLDKHGQNLNEIAIKNVRENDADYQSNGENS